MKLSRYTHTVYVERYLVLTYIEKIFSTVCCFFSYICWSVDCMSWVSKFITETEARFLFQGLKYCTLWKVDLQYSYTFFAFLSGLQIVQGTFLAFFSVSKLYELRLWIIEHILEMSSDVSINLYLRPCTIAIFGKFYLYCLYQFRLFWSINCKNSSFFSSGL